MEEVLLHTSTHHGVVSHREAIALGLTPGQLANLIRQDRLQRVARNVYVAPGSPVTWQQRARVAALSVNGLVSHRAAAAVHGIDGFEPGEIEVSGTKNRRPRDHWGYTLHQTKQFHLADPSVVDGIPLTGIARTVIDVAAVVGPKRFDWLIDGVVRQELCEWDDLFAVLQCHSVQGRNGCGPLRAVLEARNTDDAIPDSPWNRMVGQLIESCGLPSPMFEYEVRSNRGHFIARVDLAYPSVRLAIELDSRRWHMNRESFERDPRRKNRLITEGWTVLSFTWADYADRPQELVRLVQSALRRAA